MIRVLDPEQSKKFYRECFGFAVSYKLDFPNFTLIYLRNSENDFEIASANSIAGIAGGILSRFVSNRAAAEELLGEATFTTLTEIARDIFPHDHFEDDLYAKAVAIYSDQVKADTGLRRLLVTVLPRLIRPP